MKTYIWDTKNNEILAAAKNSDLAHTLAETISYLSNRNAIYGLYGIRLVTEDELVSTPNGSEAFIEWV